MEGKPVSTSLSTYTSCVFWYFCVSVTNSESWDGLESEFVILVSLSRRPSVSSTRCSESARGSGARPASTAHQSVLRGGPEVGFRDVEIDDFDREVGIFLAQISLSVGSPPDGIWNPTNRNPGATFPDPTPKKVRV